MAPTLLNVALITLLERKILAFRQFRLGPNKVSWVGFLQPIADAVKLFSNQVRAPFRGNSIVYLLSPVIGLMLVSIVWMLVPLIPGSLSVKYSSVIIVIILSFGVYPLLLSGWASDSKYAILGSLRGVTPTISYEISLALILLTFPVYANFDRFEGIIKFSKLFPLIMVLPFSCLLRLVSWLVQTNRTPFNFQKENQN